MAFQFQSKAQGWFSTHQPLVVVKGLTGSNQMFLKNVCTPATSTHLCHHSPPCSTHITKVVCRQAWRIQTEMSPECTEIPSRPLSFFLKGQILLRQAFSWITCFFETMVLDYVKEGLPFKGRQRNPDKETGSNCPSKCLLSVHTGEITSPEAHGPGQDQHKQALPDLSYGTPATGRGLLL